MKEFILRKNNTKEAVTAANREKRKEIHKRRSLHLKSREVASKGGHQQKRPNKRRKLNKDD